MDVHDLLGMIAAFGSDDETWDFDGDGLVGVNDMLVHTTRTVDLCAPAGLN